LPSSSTLRFDVIHTHESTTGKTADAAHHSEPIIEQRRVKIRIPWPDLPEILRHDLAGRIENPE
jgi:hypothetical protein